MTVAPAVPPTDGVGPVGDGDPSRDEEITGYVRSPSDVLRTVVFGLASVVVVALAKWVPDAVLEFEDDLVSLVDFLSSTFERILVGTLTVVVVVALGLIWVTPLVTRRYRLFGYIVVGNTVGFALMRGIDWFVDRSAAETLVNQVAARAGVDGPVDSVAVAQVVASFVILAPFVSRRWRRAGMVIVVLITVLRLMVSVQVPLTLFAALVVGVTVGSGVLFAFGRPSQRPTRDAIVASLRKNGLPSVALDVAAVDARGSVPYFAELADGSRAFVKVLGADQRAADLLFRSYRFVALKNVGDERPFSSLRRTVEHEALVALYARDVGIRTPRVRAIANVGSDSMLLAYDLIAGGSLDRIGPDDVDDELLRRIWEQVATMRRHSIAHRDLRQANIFVDAGGEPWIIDFGFSEVSASDTLLDADVAQLLVALSLHVGIDRNLDAAVAAVGREAVAAALPRLQANTLSGATRTALRAHPTLLGELQARVAERCGVEQLTYEDLQRLNGKTIFTILMLTAVVYFLVPQLADIPDVVDQVRDARWTWFPLVLLLSAGTYVGAALGTTGAVPGRIRALPTVLTQLASSFASKLAPAGLGGMALNVRFLQKEGIELPVATSAVGLNAVAGIVVHVLLLVVFAVWAGQSAFGSLDLPDPHVLLVGLAVVLALGAISVSFGVVRRLLRHKLVPLLRKAFVGLGDVLRRPGKLALLLGGSVTVTMCYIAATYFSTLAFGGELGFASVGAIYLVGSAVATAAPTPGGLGALEAALIAGLVSAGMDNAVAVPAVFLYRLATFWLPILPGWLAFTWLRRRDFV